VENDLYEGLPVKQMKFLRSAEELPSRRSEVVRHVSTRRDLSRTGGSIAGEVDPLRCGRAPGASTGSSVTACHNPACTAQTIEETGSHFLPARETPIVSSTTRRLASGALCRAPKLGEAP